MNYTLIAFVLFLCACLLTSIFYWWQKSLFLRIFFTAGCFFILYYHYIEELLVWRGTDLTLSLSLIVQILLGFSVYTVLYMVLFSILRYFLVVFLPEMKDRASWHNFICTTLVIILSVCTTVFSIICAYEKPQITTYKISMGKGFLPFRIAVIADLHLRKYTSEIIMTQAVTTAMSIRPDLILLLGDNVDAPQKVIQNMPALAKLEYLQAPLGIFAVTGNNDLQWNFSGDSARKFYRQYNIHLLEDEQVVLANGVTLIGRDDRTQVPPRRDLKYWKDREQGEKLIIYLDHQPSELNKHAEYGNRLIISGHTHGGQFFPLNYLYRWLFTNFGGISTKQKGVISVVSRGVGFSRSPIRLGVKPEIVVLEITPGEQPVIQMGSRSQRTDQTDFLSSFPGRNVAT